MQENSWEPILRTKKTHAVLCQDYVVQSEKITHRIRPRDEERPVLLPVGERAQFRMDKDKMKLRVEDLARGSNNLSSRLEGWSATEAGKIGGTIMTKVLIAPKNNAVNRELFRELREVGGYEVLEACGGQPALHMI